MATRPPMDRRSKNTMVTLALGLVLISFMLPWPFMAASLGLLLIVCWV